MSSSLNAIGNAAASGLASIQAGIGVVSDNIANAGVVGYTAKTQDLSTFEVGSKSFGVRVGGISRTVDAAVQVLGTLDWDAVPIRERLESLDRLEAIRRRDGHGAS